MIEALSLERFGVMRFGVIKWESRVRFLVSSRRGSRDRSFALDRYFLVTGRLM